MPKMPNSLHFAQFHFIPQAMRLSGAARKNTTVGEIVNLMSVDSQKLQDAFIYAPMLWEVLATLAPVLYFMWASVGPASMAGMGVILVMFPLNGILLANQVRKLQVSCWVLSGPTLIKPDQLDPWIKDQLGNAVLSTILPLHLRNFVSCGEACPSHMTQNFVTVGTKLLTGEWFLFDP